MNTARTLLIMSSAFVGQEMAQEYGMLPPALVPYGAGRLFEEQISTMANGRRVLLTLPDSYAIRPADAQALNRLGVHIITLSPTMGLAQAIACAISLHPCEGALEILMGDTLIAPSDPLPLDSVATTVAEDSYEWTVIAPSETNRFQREIAQDKPIVCGYLCVSQPHTLASADAGSFEDMLNSYDKAVGLLTVPIQGWNDVGHLSRLFTARKKALVARAFNRISVQGDCVTKTSIDAEKLHREAAWFEHIPQAMALHTPRYMGRIPQGYRIEYLNMPTYADLFVMGNLTDAGWEKPWAAAKQLMGMLGKSWHPGCVIDGEARRNILSMSHKSLIIDKSQERVDAYARSSTHDNPTHYNGKRIPSHQTMVERLCAGIHPGRDRDFGLFHGDVFFANLLFDSRAQRAFCIDPRGAVDGKPDTLFGDRRYDFGKMAHSAIGLYDFAIAGRLRLDIDGTAWTQDTSDASLAYARGTSFLQDLCAQEGVGVEDATAIAALLFLTMLPLHAEDTHRQNNLYGLGARLFLSLEGHHP